MMVLPAAWLMAPPTVVVNVNVAATPDLAATRSKPDTTNVGLRTLSPIGPEAIGVGLLLASFEVLMVTVVAPAVTAPIVSPLMVTVTAALPAIDDVPVSVNTMAVEVGVDTEAVLLPPLSAAVGLPEAAKNPEG